MLILLLWLFGSDRLLVVVVNKMLDTIFTGLFTLNSVLLFLDGKPGLLTAAALSDSCPQISSYLQKAITCKPSDFESKLSCEGEEMVIECRKSQRIVIYSAMFGRRVTDNSCSPQYGNDEYSGIECQVDCALQSVLESCQGRRRCNLQATVQQFGDPCSIYNALPYLNVVYTCVSKRILKEVRRSQDEEVFPHAFCNDDFGLIPDSDKDRATITAKTDTDYIPEGGWNPGLVQGGDSEEVWKPGDSDMYPSSTPPRSDSRERTPSSGQEVPEDPKSTNICVTLSPVSAEVDPPREFGLVNDWIDTVHFLKVNKEKLILYALLGLSIGIILLLTVIIIRLIQTRKRAERRAKMDVTDPVPSYPPHDELTHSLLNGNHNHSDNPGDDSVEILSYNHNRGPPPFNSGTGGSHSFNNYYG